MVMYNMFLHFNSIKVRLKPDTLNVAPVAPAFQFHKGTIKTFFRNVCHNDNFLEFQFHKGTIKT